MVIAGVAIACSRKSSLGAGGKRDRGLVAITGSSTVDSSEVHEYTEVLAKNQNTLRREYAPLEETNY